ncbi:MAG: hypothetical protein H6831_07995 [Planctomycetes bacterium]|nr:hypothetical protein [Planctomycetota bacterium]MCB9904332.1 hypothetical protein [Planctomycetota bacterium]
MRPTTILAPSLLLAALPACGPAVVGGSFEIFTPGSKVFEEREPNDSSAGPDYLTTLYAGDSIEVVGHIDDGCCDPFDGFAIDAGEPLELEFELRAHDGWSDLDFCVYDPAADVFLACFESPGDVEYGSVAIGLPAELHLVVRSWSGSTNYSLYVDAYALSGGYLAATAPADPTGDWAAYRAQEEAPFELRVERLPARAKGAPQVERIRLIPKD